MSSQAWGVAAVVELDGLAEGFGAGVKLVVGPVPVGVLI